MNDRYGSKYPPKNRRVAYPNMGPIDVVIAGLNGACWRTDPNGLAIAASQASMPLPAPLADPSDISGQKISYLYCTDEITLRLDPAELMALVTRDLLPEQYFALREKYGIFHEIHDDFYDEDTGLALQPMFDQER